MAKYDVLLIILCCLCIMTVIVCLAYRCMAKKSQKGCARPGDFSDIAARAVLDVMGKDAFDSDNWWLYEFNLALVKDFGYSWLHNNLSKYRYVVIDFLPNVIDYCSSLKQKRVNIDSMSVYVSKKLTVDYGEKFARLVGRYCKFYGEASRKLNNDLRLCQMVMTTTKCQEPSITTNLLLQVIAQKLLKSKGDNI